MRVLCALFAFALVTWSVEAIEDKYEGLEAYVAKLSMNATFRRALEEHLRTFPSGKAERLGADPCSPAGIPKGKTTSVHNLIPTDVKVVGALGDSLTSANGAKASGIFGVFQLLTEYRGVAWSVGGDDTITLHRTLPNLIKEFDPQVTGFSTNTGDQASANAHLNVAIPGGKSKDMAGQATLLIDRLQNTADINFQDDWKVITLFIGGNDLCDYCTDRAEYTAERYVMRVQEALDLLHAEVPRAFINLAQVVNVGLTQRVNDGLVCAALHLFECDCGAFPKDEAAKQELQALSTAYRDGLTDLVNSGRYDTREDFTVVVQPFFTNTDIPNKPGTSDPDLSYLAPDCFHFSEKGHGVAAEALWNNMLEPVGSKRLAWTPGEPVMCPTAAHPFFYTNLNSPKQTFGGNHGGLHALHGSEPPRHGGSSGQTAGIIAGMLGVCLLVALAVIIKRRRNAAQKQERQPLLI